MKAFLKPSPLLNYQQRLKRLRIFTLSFFLLLFIPVSLVCVFVFQQFQQEQIVKYQKHATKLSDIINKRLFKQAIITNSVSSTEFDYYQYAYNPETKKVTRHISPLADPQSYQRYEGLVGFFQIDAKGRFNSPMWPDVIEADDVFSEREAQKDSLKMARGLYDVVMRSSKIKTLITNGLIVQPEKYEVIEDVPDYFIFYRVVTVSDEVKMQGYVLDKQRYLLGLIMEVMTNKRPNELLALTVKDKKGIAADTYIVSRMLKNGDMDVQLKESLPAKLMQVHLKESNLHWPFPSYCISFSTKAFSTSSVALYGLGLMGVLLLTIALGCYGFYALGKRQLKLAEQRLNFVSSVSHELKTPLTSIRMYSEMLKSGQILSEQHRSDYYEFIFSESERLSRLIDNILQLSKLSQPAHNVEPSWVKLSMLNDVIQSKVSSLLVKNDFKLTINQPFEQPESALLWVDLDAFAQVVINITDNAVKFFDQAKINDVERQKIDFNFHYSKQQPESIQLQIRDYGFGISEAQQEKLFELFYRGGNELTRATQGTGIGLALVKELVNAQQGDVSVERMSPGLALNIRFKFKSIDA